MEHVPGRSLSDIIHEDGPLPPATVADIGAQVADGLAAAHEAGTIHRDVKPGNVLVREDGVAKVSDFGIARSAGDPALTQSGFLTGTPSYFSPELARGEDPGPEADVWALGATLYAAVEGRPPYKTRTNAVGVLHEIASGNPPRPAHADFLEPALLRMLDRDPSSRWSMRDAEHALRRLAEQHREGTRENVVGAVAASTTKVERPTPRQPVTSPREDREPTPRPVADEPADGGRRRSRAGLYALLAALALLLIVGGIAYALSQDNGSPAADGASQTPASHKPSKHPSTKATPSQQATTKQPTPTPTPTPTRTVRPAGTGTSAAAQERFIRNYFAIAPGGSERAWNMLGPGEQAQGQDSYYSFWRGISSVDVHSVVTQDGGSSPVVSLTFHETNGGSSPETKQYELIRRNGHYLINGEHPA
jgi:serine/threonine protein kinase